MHKQTLAASRTAALAIAIALWAPVLVLAQAPSAPQHLKQQ